MSSVEITDSHTRARDQHEGVGLGCVRDDVARSDADSQNPGVTALPGVHNSNRWTASTGQM